MTAKNETREVNSRLYRKITKPARSRFFSFGASIRGPLAPKLFFTTHRQQRMPEPN